MPTTQNRLWVSGDVMRGGYTPIPIYQQCNSNNDSTFITSLILASPQSCEMHLTDGEGVAGDPVSHLKHTYWVRAKKDGATGQAVSMEIRLYQGSTMIASRTGISISTGFVSYNDNLSVAEAASITNYTNLRIRIIGSGDAALPRRKLIVSQAWLILPINHGQTRIRGAGSTAYNATLY